jgi:hypothetical protein
MESIKSFSVRKRVASAILSYFSGDVADPPDGFLFALPFDSIDVTGCWHKVKPMLRLGIHIHSYRLHSFKYRQDAEFYRAEWSRVKIV